METKTKATALLIAKVQGADEADGGTEILAFISGHGTDLRCAAYTGNYLSMCRTIGNFAITRVRACVCRPACGRGCGVSGV